MNGHPSPANEVERLRELLSYRVLDTAPETAYDDITLLASQVCDCPIALVSLIDRDRQWFKSRVGLEAPETPREVAFCSHAVVTPAEVLVVEDATRDDRFADNPLVLGDPEIRFYAGMPLTTRAGHALGTLCVIDRQPRNLSDDQLRALRVLSRQVMVHLDLRKALERVKESEGRLEEANARLHSQSRRDPLTHLYNRRALIEKIEDEMARSRRHGTPLAIALLDVDRFKAFNDTFGHLVGDEVLQRVGVLLEKAKRRTDFVARFGGEEFAVVLPCTDLEGAIIVAERIRRTIAEAEWTQRDVTVSVGVAARRDGTCDVTRLLAEADRALYAAKDAGRNRVAPTSSTCVEFVADTA